jgi:Anti-sigma-K factor rskA, C-terminal
MTSDDDRIAYLAGEDIGSLDDFDQAELDDLKELLADPSLWAEPSAGLENSVVAAITGDAPVRASAPPPPPPPTRIDRHRSWRRPAAVLGALAAAAAVVIGVVIVSGDTDNPDKFEVALPTPGGGLEIERKQGGWEIKLDLPGLPRLDNGRYYQAWLKNADDVLVPIGSFNEGEDVILWAGVSPREFNTFTITREAADGDQSSSGDRVLAAPITED